MALASTRSLTTALVLGVALGGAGACGSAAPAEDSGADAGSDPAVDSGSDPEPTDSPDFDAVFVTDRVVDVELTLTESAYAALFEQPDTEIYEVASLVFDGDEVGEIGVRLKGNSSFSSVERSGGSRYSLKLDFDRVTPDLTLHGIKKLNLSNGFKDPTLLRERIAYSMFQSMGVPAGRTAHANVWINGELLGLYTMVQQVDKTFLREYFDDDEGDLYKPELQSGGLLYRGSQIESYPDLALKTNESTSDHSAFLHFVDLLNNTADGELEAALAQVLDVDAFLRYLAVSTALTNLDSYQGMGHNYYLYFDPSTGLATIIPWDLNEAFGGFTCNRPPDAMFTFPLDEPTCGLISDRPLIARVLSVASYRTAYEAYLRQVTDELLDAETFAQTIDVLAPLIHDSVAADPTKFYTLVDFEAGLDQGSQSAPGQMPAPPGLERFVTERAAFIDTQLP